ncbi:MAG: hypothetical protein WCF92_02375 [bacterium]
MSQIESWSDQPAAETENESAPKNIEYPEIEILKRPVKEIIWQLKDKIERGEYGYVVGDDASGRIPTLIFSNVLKKVYREKGIDDPKTFFFAGGRSDVKGIDKFKTLEIEKSIESFLEKNPGNGTNDRVILLTEYIVTGKSLKPICDAMKNAGIEYDIATVSASFPATSKIDKMLGAKIYEGGFFHTPKIYARTDLSGVERSKYKKEIFSNKTSVGTAEFNSQSRINSARKNIEKLSEEIFEWYKNQKEITK